VLNTAFWKLTTAILVEPAGACAMAGETEINAPMKPAAHTTTAEGTKERMSESNSLSIYSTTCRP
jgi:hypothetical protein